jgi:iron complex outermembrane receptor protein
MGVCLLVGATSVRGRAEQPQDLAGQSLEDLMKVEVTSVSKKEQTLSRTAAAVFVITQEDIQRSGATNIPDVLRMVPGMDVAQINASTWAVSARGLNGQFSNELLMLVDGRNVYTPTFGGVFWDTMDLPLENIERIEVILGPGASVWGDNAVNGVVNIIRKKAGETKGGLVAAGAGNTAVGFGTVQYGGFGSMRNISTSTMKERTTRATPETDGTCCAEDFERTPRFPGRIRWSWKAICTRGGRAIRRLR